jgi:predicted amidophosphoribosyltransferase
MRALELLALALAEYLRDTDDRLRNPVIIPIPLGAARRKERGFNQTEEIARRGMHELGFTIDTTLLVRTRETVSQVSLPRHQREENMRGAFCAAHPADPACTYIVLDDVLTTGATLQAAIDALRASGAKHIVPLALAH